nr:MAG TPA: hypothetical protein [Caudoviricetes sp.]
MKKKSKHKFRLFMLYVASFLVSIVPLVICFAYHWADYTKTPGDTVKLTFGGIIVATLVFVKVIGKLKMPRRIVSFGIAFIVAYLLQAVLKDLVLLTGMALLGEFIDYAIFQRAIKKTKEDMLIGKTADATTEQVEQVIKKYIGRA